MSNDLVELRAKIQEIDEKMVTLLAERYKAVRQVGAIKYAFKDNILNQNVFDEKVQKLMKQGKSMGLPTKMVRRIWRNIHQEAIKAQKLVWEIMDRKAADKPKSKD